MMVFRRAMPGINRIGLTLVLVCLLWTKTNAETSKVQTYVFRVSSINMLQPEYRMFLLAQQMEDTIKGHMSDSLKLKDPNMAIFYAFIPGIVVHGSGHFYAGRKVTGWILVGGEILSLGMCTYAVGAGLGESMSGSSSNINDDIAAILGGTLFFGTWIYDLIGAPLAVQKDNQNLLQKNNISLKIDFDHLNNFVRFQIVKRF